jgi:hypothetical protein
MNCPDCERQVGDLGAPSQARWIAPDGSEAYCSMHFIHRFGHGERLIRVDRYKPPSERKPPAPKKPKEKKEEVIHG